MRDDVTPPDDRNGLVTNSPRRDQHERKIRHHRAADSQTCLPNLRQGLLLARRRPSAMCDPTSRRIANGQSPRRAVRRTESQTARSPIVAKEMPKVRSAIARASASLRLRTQIRLALDRSALTTRPSLLP